MARQREPWRDVESLEGFAAIENNIVGGLSEASDNCTAPNSTATDLLVGSTSTSGTVADYNYAHTDETAMPTFYMWAGTAYTTTAAAFQAATGRAAHDSSVTLGATMTDGWGYAVNQCPHDFGDNSPTVTVAATDGTCTVSHAFAATGTYPVSIWVEHQRRLAVDPGRSREDHRRRCVSRLPSRFAPLGGDRC